jgi:phage baseplate assembly protein W
MAKPTKGIFYNPLDLDDNVGIGVTLPFGKQGGGFKLSYTTAVQALSNLKNLLSTRKGERHFQPDFGTNLPSLLFEPMNGKLQTRVDEVLREDIGLWLPYIVIDKIETDLDYDRHMVRINMRFRITEQGANQELTFTIDPVGLTAIE